jgi:hypothetical protein
VILNCSDTEAPDGTVRPGSNAVDLLCGEYSADSLKKTVLKLDIPADRVLAAVKHLALQTEQTG